jgi:hypothetical protein
MTAAEPGEFVGLRLSDFEGRIGTGFAVQTSEGEQQLVLEVAQELPQSQRPEGGFRLEFSGPGAPRLVQSTYAFSIDGTQHPIFIVATGMGADERLRYEAVFF